MARSQSRVNRQLNEEKVLDDIKKALRSHEMQQDSALLRRRLIVMPHGQTPSPNMLAKKPKLGFKNSLTGLMRQLTPIMRALNSTRPRPQNMLRASSISRI